MRRVNAMTQCYLLNFSLFENKMYIILRLMNGYKLVKTLSYSSVDFCLTVAKRLFVRLQSFL